MTSALAHISVHILHITYSAYQVFGVVAGEISFSVDIEKKCNYILLWNFPFYFILLLQVLVILSLCFECDCRLRLL